MNAWTEHDIPVFDLVVVGFGAAGAACAIRAADLGASVAIIEKEPQSTHRPSAVISRGTFMSVNDVERATTYLDACADGLTPSVVNRAWAERAAVLPQWLAGLGVALEHQRARGGDHPGLQHHDAVDINRASRNSHPDPRGGADMWARLASLIADRGIPVFWGHDATRLTQDDTGRVDGVRCNQQDRAVRARLGVVLASGGYAFSDDLKAQYLPAPTFFYGSEAATGDGIRMAQRVGAALWHMNLVSGGGIGRFTDSHGTCRDIAVGITPGGYVITDSHGRRYVDESRQELTHAFLSDMSYFDAAANEFPRIPSYWFFDSRRITGGPLGLHPGQYEWSPENERERELGWIPTGASIEAAAVAAGLSAADAAAAAAAAVSAYNDACNGAPDAFDRPRKTLIPLDSPPFYCVPLVPGSSNTQGGPARDARAHVLDVDGLPIAGLFGAGELGQVIGRTYPAAGAALSEAFCFGQIAAEQCLSATS